MKNVNGKRIFVLASSVALLMTAASCGSDNTGRSEYEEGTEEIIPVATKVFGGEGMESIYIADREQIEKKNQNTIANTIGVTDEIDYNDVLSDEHMTSMLMDYADPDNPHRLKGGVPEDPVLLRPFKSVLAEDGVELTELNEWIFPVADNGEMIGFAVADCRREESQQYYGGVMYSSALSEALEVGKIAVFQPILSDGVYGIYEDGTIITLYGDESYNGVDVTFDEIASFGYVLDSSIYDNVVYTVEDAKEAADSVESVEYAGADEE